MANFKDIIGQKQAKEHFQTAIETGNISHAYIINGETGSGRRMLADAFAKALQCEKHPNADSCDGSSPVIRQSPAIIRISATLLMKKRASVSMIFVSNSIMISRSSHTAVSIRYTLFRKPTK